MRVWVLDDAVVFLRTLQEHVELVGYHVGLAGSVLTKGRSGNDLDIILYPATTAHKDYEGLIEALERAGLKRSIEREVVTRRWRRLGSEDRKHVEVWEYGNKRVDVFFLE